MAFGPGISDLFSQVGSTANKKLLVLGVTGGSSETLIAPLRSLNLEHVSPASLMAQEISRRTQLGQKVERMSRNGNPVPEELIVAVMRRWFWARKPDAGFLLQEFPATLLQAKVFDEWLDARGENLDAVFSSGADASASVVEHYRTLGLLQDLETAAA